MNKPNLYYIQFSFLVFPLAFMLNTSVNKAELYGFAGPIGYLLEKVNYTFDQAAILWGIGAGFAVLLLLVMTFFYYRLSGRYSAILKKKSSQRREEK